MFDHSLGGANSLGTCILMDQWILTAIFETTVNFFLKRYNTLLNTIFETLVNVTVNPFVDWGFPNITSSWWDLAAQPSP